MLTWAAVMLGGVIGTVCRFAVGQLVERRSRPSPYGTFLVNIAGSFVLGLLAGAGNALAGWVGALTGTGFCGALTTYSTFGYETVGLAGPGLAGKGRALLNVVTTLVAGLGTAALGWQLGSLL